MRHKIKAWILHRFRHKTRVYILPTRMGGYLIGLIFLMFLLSIGYSNNLLLIFTLFLFAFNILWLLQTHFHLHRLKFSRPSLAHGHALEPLPVAIYWSHTPNGPWDWELKLESLTQSLSLSELTHDEEKTLGQLVIPSRGLWQWRYLKVSSVKPFGFYRVWMYFPIHFDQYVYPSLVQHELPAMNQLTLDGSLPHDSPGSEDLRSLMAYQGEESRKISWKHYAKSGELVVKEGEEYSDQTMKFVLSLPKTPLEKELYLSRLGSQMVYCFRHHIPFSFESHVLKREAFSHREHLHECLKVLALC